MDIQTEAEAKEWLKDYKKYGNIHRPLESRAFKILEEVMKQHGS